MAMDGTDRRMEGQREDSNKAVKMVKVVSWNKVVNGQMDEWKHRCMDVQTHGHTSCMNTWTDASLRGFEDSYTFTSE